MLIDEAGKVTGVLTPQRWQLTNVADLLDLNRHYLVTEPKCAQILTNAIGANVQIHPPVRIDPDTVIGAGSVIGPNVYLEANCRVGHGARVENAILLRGATVAAGATVADTVLVGRDEYGA